MTIEKKEFDDEPELHNWVEKHIADFFGDIIYLKGFQISTRRQKGGTPDGFILDLNNSSWTIIESELIRHGVWEHISEQIIRFIVASQNPATQRKIRNHFIRYLEENQLIDSISKKRAIPPHQLIQVIENIIESNTPQIAIFIDDTNQDLEDMAEALNATVKIFRVQKYLTNGRVEYLSPDGVKTTFETTIENVRDSQANNAAIIESLGGGKLVDRVGRMDIFELTSGERVIIKFSKPYDYGERSTYWYAINPKALENFVKNKVSHIVFIMGQEGLVKVPMPIIQEYLVNTQTTKNPDGSISHYHITIFGHPEPIFYITKRKKTWNLESYFIPVS
jgi:hypothetical protein